MSVPKRHHTLPQFYLRGFSREDQISTVQLPGERRFKQSVRKAASETNFYSLDGYEGGVDAFEKWLSGVEGHAADVIKKIESGIWPLDPEDRATLAYFIALQAVRGPDQRRNMEHIQSEITRLEVGFGGKKNVAKWAETRLGLQISSDEEEALWEAATSEEGLPVKVAAAAHVKQIIDVSDEIFPILAGRPWSLYRFERRSLLTCDSPVSLTAPVESEPWGGVGFMTAWGISYPISRKIGLLMSDPTMLMENNVPVERVHEGKFDQIQAATTAMEKFFNSLTASSANFWIYHHPEDESFVPDKLPKPQPVTMGIAGGPRTFNGEPLFNDSEDADPVVDSVDGAESQDSPLLDLS